jgi:hypothetical protein
MTRYDPLQHDVGAAHLRPMQDRALTLTTTLYFNADDGSSACFSQGHRPEPILKSDLSHSASLQSRRPMSSFYLRRLRGTLKSP